MAALVFSALSVAHANPKYAAYVIHAETGDVLFDRYSNEDRYPASLTKMMTLYLLFEAIEDGTVKMDDEMTVSKRASLQPASHLGLERGTKIDVDTAIQALVIRSANDVATVVAEHLGGTELKFAGMMTEKAHDLGMRRTTFRNASGLPDRRQTTTARDMAILSQRLTQDFPKYFHYFDQNSFTWQGRTYRSHNRVAMTLDGADGLKTGYTRASGFNLATTAARGDHRLIGVVLGGRSTATRDRHMIQILETAFADIKKKPSLIASVHSIRPVPSLRPDRARGIPAQVLAAAPAPSDSVPMPSAKSLPSENGAIQMAALDMASLEMAIADSSVTENDIASAPIGEGDAELSGVRDWIIQVGAYREQPLAIKRIRDTQDTVRAISAEAGREVNIAEKGAQAVYRARFTRMTEIEAADSCSALISKGDDCIALHVSK
ncbi:D-alanyl-D-alanine carboxypeptidase family protein [Parvularcula sp. LCG005]|uniref:D-alanyl-D-alanine carboxypeptidase family protein n=1 Tax=Parvularcula sp. LCG005 TaxID=3078805 RepID=UPI002942D53F|nr:D-alanyl-D-alanine carboxypeptidase family protein [Parvularcula sp. LCG005]WOI52563.1 D-alanyl-D-alanine carboxypeptidase family protein [Parvularcula sp. LCG005]